MTASMLITLWSFILEESWSNLSGLSAIMTEGLRVHTQVSQVWFQVTFHVKPPVHYTGCGRDTAKQSSFRTLYICIMSNMNWYYTQVNSVIPTEAKAPSYCRPNAGVNLLYRVKMLGSSPIYKTNKQTKNLVAFSPQAKYTGRKTAASLRTWCQFLRVGPVVSATGPLVLNFVAQSV
jgi:hypothetical protein